MVKWAQKIWLKISMPKFCHELDDFSELCQAISNEKNILPQLVEKDYWVMHCLYGLEKLGIEFEMKGGTSLSKGWGLLERFSEDIDLQIENPKPQTLGFLQTLNPSQKGGLFDFFRVAHRYGDCIYLRKKTKKEFDVRLLKQ